MRFKINLLDDQSVITADGEYLGTWDTDETDVFYEFTPDGETTTLLSSAFIGPLCKAIEIWHLSGQKWPPDTQTATGNDTQGILSLVHHCRAIDPDHNQA